MRERIHCICLKKQVQITIVVLVGIAAGAALLFAPHHAPEPVFQGKPASYWIARIDNDTVSQQNFKTTEGITVLLRALECRNSKVGKIYLRLWHQLPTSMRKHVARPLDAQVVRTHAIGTFFYWCAFETPLIEKEKLIMAAPGLVRALEDDDKNVRFMATSALKVVSYHYPDISELVHGALPALIERLQKDPDSNVRYMATLALSLQRTFARPAVPVLVAALSDKDRRVRECATNALIVIDNKALPRRQPSEIK